MTPEKDPQVRLPLRTLVFAFTAVGALLAVEQAVGRLGRFTGWVLLALAAVAAVSAYFAWVRRFTLAAITGLVAGAASLLLGGSVVGSALILVAAILLLTSGLTRDGTETQPPVQPPAA